MYKYIFHCPKCGYYEECACKDDYRAAKSWHKREGCKLGYAPHKNGVILAREELAQQAWAGFEKKHMDKQGEEPQYDIFQDDTPSGQ